MTPDSVPITPRAKINLAAEPDFAIGAMAVRPSASEIEIGGVIHKIEPRVAQVLLALIQAAESVVSRDVLIQTCWGGIVVGEDAINRAVGRVRHLAELTDPPAFRVDTIPKIGYRLVRPAASEAAIGPEAERTAIGAPTPAARLGRFLPLALAAIAAAAVAHVLLSPRLAPDSRADKAVAVAMPPRIAVIPFSLGRAVDEDQAYLAEGIAEEILARLARVDQIAVIGIGSTVAISGVTDDMQEMGRLLGARFILAGGFGRDGESLRLEMRLVDVQDGNQIWTESFEGSIKDVSAIEEKITRAVARALDIAVPASSIERNASSANPNAHEFYLKGLAAIQQLQFGGESGAVALMARAVEIDPGFTEARAKLALAYALQVPFIAADEEKLAAAVRSRRLAAETALIVLAADPDNPSALTALAAVRGQERRFGEARTLLEKAVLAAPEDNQPVTVFANLLARTGQLELSKKALVEALSHHPVEPRILRLLADIEMLLGDYESATVHAGLAHAFAPDMSRWIYVMSLAALGRTEEGEEIVAADIKTTGALGRREEREQYWRLSFEAFASVPGRERYIAAIGAQLEAHNLGLDNYDAPRLLNMFGETELRDRVLLYLIHTGYFDRVPMDISELWAPWAANVRATPQFKDLVKRAQFVPYWNERGWPKGCWPKGADDFACG